MVQWCSNKKIFARFRHQTTTTNILQFVVFWCKLELLLFKSRWDCKILIRKQETRTLVVVVTWRRCVNVLFRWKEKRRVPLNIPFCPKQFPVRRAVPFDFPRNNRFFSANEKRSKTFISSFLFGASLNCSFCINCSVQCPWSIDTQWWFQLEATRGDWWRWRSFFNYRRINKHWLLCRKSKH